MTVNFGLGKQRVKLPLTENAGGEVGKKNVYTRETLETLE